MPKLTFAAVGEMNAEQVAKLFADAGRARTWVHVRSDRRIADFLVEVDRRVAIRRFDDQPDTDERVAA